MMALGLFQDVPVVSHGKDGQRSQPDPDGPIQRIARAKSAVTLGA